MVNFAVCVAGLLIGGIALFVAHDYRKVSREIAEFVRGRYIWSSPPSRTGVQAYYEVKRMDYFRHLPFDDEGVPLVDYKSLGLRRNPVTIAQYALSVLNTYVETGAVELRDEFLRLAEWFVHNANWDRGFAALYYDFPWLNLRPPWISGMAQGQVISVLVRAYQLTRRVQYLDK